MQQQRVRGNVSLTQALAEFDSLGSPVFLSYELLHLYGGKYLESVSRSLEFPIDSHNPQIAQILAEDTNAKYFAAVDHHATDDLARHSSRKWQ
jgi:hypothetical protein